MNELKTLKDFEDGLNCGCNGCDISSFELRQEVIKHIKSKIKRIEEHSHKKFDWNNPYMDCLQCRNYFVQIQWIKHFFNITKEDLK